MSVDFDESAWREMARRATERMAPKQEALPEQASRAAAKAARAGWRPERAPSPEEATALLADMLPHPQYSRAGSSRLAPNLEWLACAERLARPLAALSPRLALPEASCSKAPPGFAAARIKALAELGADPVAANALARAVFRGSVEETQAALAMPGIAPVGQAAGRGASALHRAAYDGGDEIFALLARASAPSDWTSLDGKGRSPFSKALQGRALKRVKTAFALTAWELFTQPPTPLSDAVGVLTDPALGARVVCGPAWAWAIQTCVNHPLLRPGIFLRADGSSFQAELAHLPSLGADIERLLLDQSTPAASASARPRI